MASFYKANSLIRHVGPIPLNWSRVQGKLFGYECIEHPAQYLVAKTQFIINISKKLTNETRLRYISTIKHLLHLKWYASERPPCKVNTTVLTWLSKEKYYRVFFLSISKWVLWLVSWKPSHESRNWNESSFGRLESSFTDLLTYRRWLGHHGKLIKTKFRYPGSRGPFTKYNLGKILGLWHPGQGCGKESYKQRKGGCLLTLLNWTWTLTMLACSQILYFLF